MEKTFGPISCHGCFSSGPLLRVLRQIKYSQTVSAILSAWFWYLWCNQWGFCGEGQLEALVSSSLLHAPQHWCSASLVCQPWSLVGFLQKGTNWEWSSQLGEYHSFCWDDLEWFQCSRSDLLMWHIISCWSLKFVKTHSKMYLNKISIALEEDQKAGSVQESQGKWISPKTCWIFCCIFLWHSGFLAM